MYFVFKNTNNIMIVQLTAEGIRNLLDAVGEAQHHRGDESKQIELLNVCRRKNS